MLEFQDPVPDLGDDDLQGYNNAFFWTVWDSIKNKRIKLRWGWFRPSFRLYVFEPVIAKVLGPRPSTTVGGG